MYPATSMTQGLALSRPVASASVDIARSGRTATRRRKTTLPLRGAPSQYWPAMITPFQSVHPNQA